MELAELKRELYTLIEKTEDEQTLLDVAQMIKGGNQLEYENTDTFWNAINKAKTSIAEGKGITDAKAREMINSL